jgi:hypothetical protein
MVFFAEAALAKQATAMEARDFGSIFVRRNVVLHMATWRAACEPKFQFSARKLGEIHTSSVGEVARYDAVMNALIMILGTTLTAVATTAEAGLLGSSGENLEGLPVPGLRGC